MPSAHIVVLLQVPAVLFPIQLPSSVSLKAGKDGPSCTTATHVGYTDGISLLTLF